MADSVKAVYEYLKSFDGAFSPSVREICVATGIKSTSTVHNALNVLARQGLIDRDQKTARSIKLKSGKSNPEMYNSIADYITKKPCGVLEISNDNKNIFALKHRASNDFDNILAGDVIIFERTSKAKDDDIVIASTGRQTLIRRYNKTPDGHILTNNSQPLPMVLPEIKILARAIGLYRKF